MVPTAHYIKNRTVALPKNLNEFLRILATGKPNQVPPNKSRRFIDSFVQNICRAIT